MCINRVSQFSIVVVASLLLGACGGGGGGGGGGSSSPTPATATFPVAQANAQMIINGYQATLSITGKVNDVNVSGTGTIATSPAVAATFAGQAVMSNTSTITATVSGGGKTIPVTVTVLDYVDSNYNELATLDTTDGTLTAMDQVVSLPATVHVGDSGSLGSATDYSDSTKTIVMGTEVATYSVVADTATSIIFVVTSKSYDTSHNLTGTAIQRIRITEAGLGTWLSEQLTEPDGTQFTFTAQ